MQVYLIRHAQSEQNVQLDDVPLKTRMSRSTFNALLRAGEDSPLTPTGLLQAQDLAQRLEKQHFARLYASPLLRAAETAAALSQTTGLTPQIIDDLSELRAVLLREGTKDIALWHLFLSSYSRMFFSPASPDAFLPVYRRVRKVWNQITSEPAEAIIVVSHGWLLRMMLLSLWTERRWQIVSHDFANCGISLVVSRDEVRKRTRSSR